jgi:hypothetical protein
LALPLFTALASESAACKDIAKASDKTTYTAIKQLKYLRFMVASLCLKKKKMSYSRARSSAFGFGFSTSNLSLPLVIERELHSMKRGNPSGL